MINSEQVGRRIAILRREKQLSQEQLAEQLHVSAQAVSKWETGRSLPETSTLPLLSAVLGHSIDSLLLPQELAVLSAVYTDGNEQQDVTHWVNQLITGNTLTLSLGDQFFQGLLQSDRAKLLLVKYGTPSGIYLTFVLKGQLLQIDVHSQDYPLGKSGLTFVHAAYGNERAGRDVLQKMKHYAYFEWTQFTVDQELFPSTMGHEGSEYLLLVYLNADGIHAVSCAEGERIHYTSDRARLFAAESGRRHCIIEKVNRLGFGRGMDCSWAGALYTSLSVMGIETSYEAVMGVSGACWRAAFAPVWDYSAADALAAYDFTPPVIQAYGLLASWANRLTSEERKQEKLTIMESLHHQRLPVALNLRVAPEWGVITGYLDNGNTLLCRSYFDEETFTELKDDPEFQEAMKSSKGYLYVDHWPYKLLYLEKHDDIPPALDSLYASLRIKLEAMQANGQPDYHVGYKALASWQDGLLDEDWYTAADAGTFIRRYSVNHFCMMALTDARRSAAVYLKASLGLVHHPSAVALMSEMAADYEQMDTLLSSFYSSMPLPAALEAHASPKQLWNRESRKRQAELLHTIAGLDRRGDELAAAILEQAQLQ
ncbi:MULTISPECIES: helix-turn-helix transcriptional regulator [unclassified Paenibacillus]|uniref:helix-turn-helix domain-containing protein n=1 Tax=unclassified Paenibacillus TaxID=185978 RepID=UPI002405CCE6|nr:MULTISPECIES: helix-turn-helix transcriptional regulator [unclassified Paenibacillus]MDF9840790.1 transcriptional regulator with XRE-family HTH domain [Paenibacillus sp. PastF-2]MDF9847373.1 transcriptional regulator with XRE-family HTH domain [Paenibacillus sp. PastM-2]MDF9854049.1 transcriptional regulator with XRE-family HTH domain [Paenibacillus sp. PastF-1]MDH6479322.1 transcriptional regulator with XRE-family HTH domain [Paenibacillus sp. PastH-2]MDH6506945.1 transcriptional regulator